MSDFVEVTRQGLGSRAKGSLFGVLIGILMVLGGIFLLFKNEERSVKRYKDLKEGAGAVVSIPSDKVDAATEGKLVHLTGDTRTSAPLGDPDFGVSVPAVKLIRDAEMFQWVEIKDTETRNKTGGGTETVTKYRYSKEWRDSPVDSSGFKSGAGHVNPKEMAYRDATVVADDVTLGAFDLPAFLVQKIGGAQPLPIETLDGASEAVRTAAKLADGGVYFGADPDSPAVGDQRVRFTHVPTGPVSVVAQQSGATFIPYQAKTGGTVELLEPGTVDAAGMFQKAQDRNKMLTWAIRVGGFFLLGIGFSLILGPIAVIASVIPFLGRLAETGTTIIAFLLAGILWTLTVSFAWIFYRPVLGVSILVVTLVLFFLVVKRLRRPAAPPLQMSPPPLS